MSFRYNLEGSLLASRAGTAVHKRYRRRIAHSGSQTVLPPMRRRCSHRLDKVAAREEKCACNHDGSNAGKNISATSSPVGLNADDLRFLYDVLFTVVPRETLPVAPQGGFIRANKETVKKNSGRIMQICREYIAILSR